MNLILSLPLQARLFALFVIGACVGGAINLAAYQLAWYPRPISPWSGPDPSAPPRRWWDRLPIVGWLGLRREAALHGIGFWIRPLCVELLAGVGLAWLYWWEVASAGLLPAGVVPLLPADVKTILHLQFAAHALLIAVMLVASLIDIDEKIIPDAVVVPGTLVGLLIAAVWPWSLLPDVASGLGQVDLRFLTLTAPMGGRRG